MKKLWEYNLQTKITKIWKIQPIGKLAVGGIFRPQFSILDFLCSE